jgi:predicted DNA-binding transcriptional regulator AlpA
MEATTTREPETEPLLISVDALARMLDISPRSVWRRLSSGEMIEPVRIGTCVRWRRQEVEAWIAAGCPPISEWKWR